LRYPVGLGNYLKDADLLMLHSGWVYHNARAARDAQRAGVPYLITPHGAYDPNVFARRRAIRELWWRTLEDPLLRRALAVHVSFEGERLQLERRYSGPVIVAPYGFAAPQLGHERPRSGDYLLWMGRFDVQQKGIDLLLTALARLPSDHRPRTRLHGPDFRGGKQAALNMVRQLGLERDVTVEPPIYGDDKWRALRECKLFVFSSRWDSNSVAVLEAASAGAPIVATSTTFIGQAFAAEEAAILVDADASSMADGILAASSPEARRVGARAAQVVREKFSWPSVAESFLRQLEKLL
jgi:glycosyltransferase involved in cell wall biosynthesis